MPDTNIVKPKCSPFKLPFKADIEMRNFSVLRYNEFKSNYVENNQIKTGFETMKEELLAQDKDSLVISFDTEWQENQNHRREILSYQFTTYYKGQIREYMFIPKTTEPLSLGEVFSVIGNDYKINLSSYPIPKNEKGYNIYPDEVPVYLLAHNALCDITNLRDFERAYSNLMETNDVFTKRPFRVLSTNLLDRNTYRTMQVNVVGTMNHYMGSLASLGQSVGVNKIELPEGTIEHMEEYRKNHFTDYAKYAMRDTHVIMEWYLHNFKDLQIPPTTSGFAERLMVKAMGGINNVRDFRGVEYVTNSIERNDGSSYLKSFEKFKTPLAAEIAKRASEAYAGGFNACMKVGYYDTKTYDFDLRGAYPTAGTTLPNINFNATAPLEKWKDKTLTKQDLGLYPYTQFGFGRVNFEFPENIKFPCIAIKSDNGLVFPRKGENVPTTWAEVKMALAMGATVQCLDFEMYEPERNEKGKIVGNLAPGFKFFAEKRKEIADIYGKGSPKEITAKLTNNAIYGKISQNLVSHNIRNVATNEMEVASSSSLTSPAHAAYITALVRCALCGTMEQLSERGFNNFSVTTDGFISDAPIEEINKCNIYGLRDVLSRSNNFLTGNPDVWAVKHEQERLFNITTRVNQGFGPDDKYISGVVSAATGYKGDDFVKDYLERPEEGMHITQKRLPNLNEMIWKGADYVAETQERIIKFNYDFKRDVDQQTLEDKPVSFEGKDYSIVNFETNPYDSFDSYIETKKVVDRSGIALREVSDYITATSPTPEVRDNDRGQIINAIYFMDRTPGYHNAFVKMGPKKTVDLLNDIAKQNGVDLNLTKQVWKQMQKENKFKEELNRPLTTKVVVETRDRIINPQRQIVVKPTQTPCGELFK